MALFDKITDLAKDAYREAKDAYVQVQTAKAQAPYQASYSAQRNLLEAENAAPENARVLTPAQLTQASNQAAQSYAPTLGGFWNSLQGWQKGAIGLSFAGLALMGVRAAVKK